MQSKLLLILFLLLVSCSSKQEVADTDQKSINLELRSLKRINIDSLLTNPRFVPLETSKECIIDTYDDIVIKDSIIFILSNSGSQQAIFAFNFDGRFLFKLDALGRGPEEYLAITAFFANNRERYLEVASQEIKRYGYDGKHQGNLLILKEYGAFTDFLWHSDKYYAFAEGIAIQFKSTGKKTNAFKVFDSDWNLINQGYPVDMGITSSPFETRSKYFFTDSEKAYFSHPFSDTIYEINGKSLTPKYILNYGENALPDDEKLRLATLPPDMIQEFYRYFRENKRVVIGPDRLGITDSLIYFGITYGFREGRREAFFNRTTGNAVALNNSRLYGPLYPKTIFCSGNQIFGLIDPKSICELSSGKFKGTKEADLSPFSPRFFSGFYDVSPEDNMVLVFFDVNRF